ncbi:MAG: DUF3151 domain-containing protein [Dermabacter sp.]|nr:DUF3151 domain-containing protein [Dermabacter sp.]
MTPSPTPPRTPSGPSPHLGGNLMAPAPTLLPEIPDQAVRAAAASGTAPRALAAAHPESSLAWSLLADDAWADGDTVASYAFARVGYHRGLDALRRAGWRGAGPVPFSHEANRGFLSCLLALGRAADEIGEDAEVERIRAFLQDADPSLTL